MIKNKKIAQQLVEFLLVAPFLIIMLGILTEYAYALNINMTLTQGLKTAASTVYGDIKPGSTPSGIKYSIKTNLKSYLSENNVPLNSENDLTVGYVISGDVAVITAAYTYIPAFTLPNIYFKFMPKSFNFLATTALPVSFLGYNNYPATDSVTLDKIWSSSASFSNLDSFNSSKTGVMKNTNGRSHVLFLISNPEATSLLVPTYPSAKAYALVAWSGATLKNFSDVYNVDTSNGRLYYCTSTACTYYDRFMNYANSKGYHNIIFVDNTMADYSNYSTKWAYNCSTNAAISADTADLSPTTTCGVLKASLALIDSSNLSVGNYDNIAVSGYNSAVSSSNKYSMQPFGSTIFMYPTTAGITISNITSGASATNYDYNFGAKIN